jgi:hypothetical protein
MRIENDVDLALWGYMVQNLIMLKILAKMRTVGRCFPFSTKKSNEQIAYYQHRIDSLPNFSTLLHNKFTTP